MSHIGKIGRITLREIRMPLVSPFETSFGLTTERRIILVEVQGEGVSGWGEVTAGEGPFYNEEWSDSAWLILKDFAIPRLLAHPLSEVGEAAGLWESIRENRMATGGLEASLWEWQARLQDVPLHQLLGGKHRASGEISCGVSIGIQPTIDGLLRKIATEVAAGYQRVKVKIKPGWDIEVLEKIRERFPRLRLMADANSAYRLEDKGHLKMLDRFYLMMIEQPLAHDDIMDHARLQQYIETPICLDESIRSLRHAEQAVEMKACQIINIKLGRVGGFRNAKLIHDCCQAARVPVWCGGMLESGVGRAANIALSTLPNFVLPGDVSASQRYWKRDVVIPEVTVTPRGTIEVPQSAGNGFDVDRKLIASLTVREVSLP